MGVRSDTRVRMIEAATSLMRRHGFAATSLKDVWELSGTPRGSVYFHFPGGKEELGREVIRNALDLLLEWTRQARREAGSAAEFLRALGGKLGAFLQAGDFETGCPIAAIALEAPREFPGLRAAANAAVEAWSGQIAEALQAYGIAPDRSMDTARVAASALEGAILVSKSARNTEALELTSNLLAETLG